MKVTIDVPEYDKWKGISVSWVEGQAIEVRLDNNEIGIWANKEGLISLATQMLILAQDAMPSGNHIDLGSDSDLDENSLDLTIGKK